MTKDDPIRGLIVGQTDVSLNELWKISNEPKSKRI